MGLTHCVLVAWGAGWLSIAAPALPCAEWDRVTLPNLKVQSQAHSPFLQTTPLAQPVLIAIFWAHSAYVCLIFQSDEKLGTGESALTGGQPPPPRDPWLVIQVKLLDCTQILESRFASGNAVSR